MRDPNKPKEAVYIGRPSRYANPYSHRKGKYVDAIAGNLVSTREESIEKFKEYIKSVLEGNTTSYYTNEFISYDILLLDLKDKDLVCFCAPTGGLEYSKDRKKICHGEVLSEIIQTKSIDGKIIEGNHNVRYYKGY